MKEFNYDVVQLINAVKERPCLWDKTLEVHKDRFERRKAWEEIFHLLDMDYDSMTNEEKRLTGETVLNKWTNIRDTFVKSLRPKFGKPRRKYVLHDHLEFLTKCMSQETTVQYEEEVTYLKEEHVSEEEIMPKKRSKRIERSDDSYSYTPNTSKSECNQNRRRSKKKDSTDAATSNTKGNVSSNEIDFVEVAEINQSTDHNRLMNEDEAFFASLLPTVVKYNEDERLEFRIEVLGIMQKIKEARKWCVVDMA